MFSFFIGLEIIGILLIFAAIYIVVSDKDGTRDQKLISCFLVGSLLQNFGYMEELLAKRVWLASGANIIIESLERLVIRRYSGFI